MNGLLPFNQALAVLLLTPEFFLPLRRMALRFHAGTAGKTAAARIFAVLDTPLPEGPAQLAKRVSPAPVKDGDQTGAISGDIRLQDVHVAYAQGQRPALKGISLTIGEGQTVALVGPTGAGKSTVAQLLLRFIKPNKGMIAVGKTPLAAIEPEMWRAQVAWVPQNPHLFFGSVADNLRLARPQATEAELKAAVQAAHADTFIQSLPQGFDTPIGEEGFRLSGGQRQRLAIARAFLKDAPILILDEATANLDAANERLVRDALAQLSEDRTVLIIAHRLQMVHDADEIVVLEKGQIVEKGDHAQLLAQGGRYQALALAYAGGAL